MTVSPVASSEKIQTALNNLGTPNGFIAYDIVPLLQQLVVALGNISTGGSASATTGEGKLWFTNTAPSGWLICDGAAVSRTTYADLFAVIGTTYGAGDSSTTFNLPDFQGRAPVGKSSVGTFDTLAEAIGDENPNTLETNSSGATFGADFFPLTGVSYALTANPGNIQPSLVVNFIIKT